MTADPVCTDPDKYQVIFENDRVRVLEVTMEPGARPGTADELASQLACVRTANDWTAARAREWWDTHRPVTGRISIPH